MIKNYVNDIVVMITVENQTVKRIQELMLPFCYSLLNDKLYVTFFWFTVYKLCRPFRRNSYATAKSAPLTVWKYYSN